jgi:dipeptidyl aminopeptidase/acylaminoacyl peptidase
MRRSVAKYRAMAAALALCAGPIQAQGPSVEPSEAPVNPAAPAAQKQGRLAVEAFAQIPFVESVTLSPDGSRVAGLLGVEGAQHIAIMALFGNSEKPVVIGVPESTEVAWLRWVNDDNVIVGLRALVPFDLGERAYVSRLISINRTTGKLTRLLWDLNGQNTSDVLWIPTDGGSEIAVSAQNSIYLGEEFYPSVYRVDVVTARRKLLVKGRSPILYWNADSSGKVRVGTGYADEGRQSNLVYRGEGSQLTFRTIDRANSRKRESLLSPFLFLPGTDHALVMDDDEKGLATVYEIDLITQAKVSTVFSAPGGAEVSGPIVSSDGETVLGYGASGAIDQVHWIDPQFAEVQALIDKAVGDRKARIIDFNRDRSRMLISVTRADAPGSLYFFDVADGRMQRIAYFNQAIGARSLNPVSLIRYKARDGLEIEAVLTLPKDYSGAKDRAGKKLPIIMLPHGGPWGQDSLTYDYWAQFIASRGYAVLQPNFRGSTGYGTDFLAKGEGQMGLAMQDDITDGLRWAVAQGIADPARACIVGASYGGYAAMWGIAKDPDLYRCAISIAGVANIRREVNDFGGDLLGGRYKDDWKRMTPDFPAVSPMNAIARIKAPLLLIHGKKDITVDFGQSSSMYGRMKDAGKQVELVTLAEADHHFTRQADRTVLLQSIETFLAKHNPAD